ncbi:MAG: hypothetical protein NXI10_14655 [bacterium]|nr:hypothetical protein [bacterium]
MAESSIYFKIKRSYVHITDDAIKMWADPSLAGFKESSGIGSIIFGILTKIGIIVFFAYRFIYDYRGLDSIHLPFIFLVAGITIVYVWQIVYLVQFNYTNNIPRNSIAYVEYKKGIPLLIAGQIIIHFDKNGKRLKRSFVLSGLFQSGDDHSDVLQILKDTGLYRPGDDNEDLLDS